MSYNRHQFNTISRQTVLEEGSIKRTQSAGDNQVVYRYKSKALENIEEQESATKPQHQLSR